MIGSTTGACLNPAVGLCQSIFQYDLVKNKYGTTITLDSMWIYILGPALGGILGGFFGVMNEKIHHNCGLNQDSDLKLIESRVKIIEKIES